MTSFAACFKKLQCFSLPHEGGCFTCASLGHQFCNIAVTGGQDRTVYLWSIGKADPVIALTGHQTGVESVALSWDECRVAGGSAAGVVKVWDVAKNQISATLTGHKAGVTCLIFNPLEKFLLSSGSSDFSVKLWDTRSPKAANATIKNHSKKICCVDFSPDGRWLVTGSDDCHVKIWDLAADKQIADLAGHSGPVAGLQFHPNEYLLASASADKTVRFWDLETFECVGQSETDTQPIQQIAFHPSGECLFAASRANLRVLAWEPTRTFDSAAFVFDPPLPSEAPPSGLVNKLTSCTVHPNQPDTVIFAELTDQGRCVNLFTADLRTLQPFAKGQRMADDSAVYPSTTACVSDEPPVTPPVGKMRRSFHEKKIQISPVNDDLKVSSVGIHVLKTNSSNSGDMSPVASKEEKNFCLNYTSAFKPKHMLKRSPTRNPAAQTMQSSHSGPNLSCGATFQQPAVSCISGRSLDDSNLTPHVAKSAASVSPRMPRKSDQLVPGVAKAPKAKATVLPQRFKPQTNLAPKIVQQVPPHIRSKIPAKDSSERRFTTLLEDQEIADFSFDCHANSAGIFLNAAEFLPSTVNYF